MNTLKVRKVGNSMGIIIPAGYGLELGTELIIGKGSDGSPVITTALADPFDNPEDFDDMVDEFADVVPVGREWGGINE